MPGHAQPAETPAPCPPAVTAVAERLRAAGHRAWLTGEALLRRIAGIAPPLHQRLAFEILTSATPAEVLACLERAVPICARAAAVSVPTAAGPVDVVPCQRPDPPRGDLAVRDFTLHAMAQDPLEGELLDPFDGRGDWSRRTLRCPGSALDRLRERPERALRALRCAAEYGTLADDELRAALPRIADALGGARALAARREIFRWLSLEDPGPGLRLARDSGLEASLAPGARSVGLEAVAAIPTSTALRIPLRLAVWLQGSSASSFLRRFRVGEPVSSQVLRLLAHHPVERTVRPSSEASVARLERRLGRGELAALIAWRQVEISQGGADSEARARLDALRESLARAAAARAREERRRTLAIHGEAVMRILDCGPGPVVGRALAALGEWVAEDPKRNDPTALERRLREWAREAR